MLKFNSYNPTYVPQPIEQIGKALESLDKNNERISQGYEKLSNTLLSLDVRPEDQDIIQGTYNNLATGMDELLSSGDYSTMSGGLSNLTKKHLLQNNTLKASINRSKQYEDFKKAVADRYHKGELGSERYNYFYNQPYIPTSQAVDQNGVVDPNYKDFRMPVKEVDMDAFLRGIANTVGTDAYQNAPEYEYYTKGDLKSLYQDNQDDPNFNPDESTDFVKLKTIKAWQTKSKDKLRRALSSGIATNDEVNAYVKELAQIRGVSETDLINNYITPYLEASTYVDNSFIDDSGSKFQQQLAMQEFRNKSMLEKARMIEESKSEKEKGFASGEYIGEVNIGETLKQADVPFKIPTNFYVKGTGMFAKDDISYTSDNGEALNDDEYYRNYVIDSRAEELYGTEYNQLDRTQRKRVLNDLNENHKKLTTNALLNQNAFTLGADAKNDAKSIIFGSNEIDAKHPSIGGSASYTGFYSIEDGKIIKPNEIPDYINSNKLEGSSLDVVARLDPSSKGIALALGDYGYEDGYFAMIGNKRVIVPNQRTSFNRGMYRNQQKVELLLSDIGENKQTTHKVIPFRQDEEGNVEHVAVNYRKIPNKPNGIYEIYAKKGDYTAVVEEVKNDRGIITGYIVKTPNTQEANGENNGLFLDASKANAARAIHTAILDGFDTN